jgi:carbonic anhydrase
MLKVLAVALIVQLVAGNGWDYDPLSDHGPNNWYHSYEVCGGQRQSPINIVTHDVHKDDHLGAIQFVNYDQVAASPFSLINNGHSVQLTLPTSSVRPSIKGAGLSDEYTLEQIHFHWSQSDSFGSEHLVDGQTHEMEMHLVHYNSAKYASVADSLNDPQGVAVIGVFVSVKHLNDGVRDLSVDLGRLSHSLPNVDEEGTETIVPAFAINGLLPATKDYYRYMGSLTTPGCAESVVWTVLKEPIHITPHQLDLFRTIHTDGGAVLDLNYRPPQPLNGRKVYENAAK